MLASLVNWLTRRPGAWLFCVGYLTTWLVMPGSISQVSDTAARLAEAHWLWTGVSPEGTLEGRWGVRHWHFGLGQSLVLLPADLLVSGLLGLRGGAGGEGGGAYLRYVLVSYLVFPFINGLAVRAGFQCLVRLGFTLRPAAGGALALLFASSYLWHCQNNQENPFTLWLTLMGLNVLLAWLKGGRSWRLGVAAAALGYSLLIRLPNAANVLAVLSIPILVGGLTTGEPLAARGRSVGRYLRGLLVWAAPMFVVSAAVDRLYHWVRFAQWRGNYWDLWAAAARRQDPTLPASMPFSSDFLDGFLGPFLAPGKSIFLYDPLIVLALGVVLWRWGRLPVLLRAVVLAVLAMLLFTVAGYARFYAWGGDAAWGYRYGSIPVHLLVLLAVPLLWTYGASVGSGWRRRWLVFFLAVSLPVQAASLIYPCWMENLQASGRPVGTPISSPERRTKRRWCEFTQGPAFFIGYRFRNIVADLTGNVEKWDLRRVTPQGEVGLHPPMLVPLEPLNTLAPGLRFLVKAGWWSGLIVLVGALVLFRRRVLGRPEVQAPERCGPSGDPVEERLQQGNPWYVGSHFEWAQKPEIKPIYEERFGFFRECVERAKRRFGPPLLVLDAGCGDGYWLHRLGTLGGLELTGVDYNPLRIERAKQAAPGARIECAPLAEFKPAGLFDVVLLSQVIEHVQDDVGLLRQVKGLLRPEGTLILGAPNEGSRLHRWRNWRLGAAFETDHVHFYTEAELQAKLAAAGFRIERTMREVWYVGNDRLFYALTRRPLGYKLLALLTRWWPGECSDYYFECRAAGDEAL